MASPSRLSLIPYDSGNREVVLRHHNAVVVYDQQSSELSLRATEEQANPMPDCPYCHRPLTDRANDSDHARPADYGRHDNVDTSFVKPDYFRMLAHTLSRDSDEPDSPLTDRPLPALRYRHESPTNDQGPPSGAEFVGSAPCPSSSSARIRGSSFSPGYFAKFFVEQKLLGRGGRGVVHLVEHILDDVSLGQFACKRIPVGDDHGWLAKVLVEVQLLQQLNHLNLVSYRHVWLEDSQMSKFSPSVPCVFILQQYCNAGDLHSYVRRLVGTPEVNIRDIKTRRASASVNTRVGASIHQPSRRLALDEIFSFFKDITSGLHHLHTHGYIHRDLKPSNCLLNVDGSKTTVLVSDFGEVQVAGTMRMSTGATGTISYCAPETLTQDKPDGTFGNFTTSSDIFSLGMIVFFMCFGRLPYMNADIDEEQENLDLLRQEILAWPGFKDTDKIRDDLPERLYKSLKRLLSLEAVDRPSTGDILQGIRGAPGFDEAEAPPHGSAAIPGRFARRSSTRKQSLMDQSQPLADTRSGETGAVSIAPAIDGQRKGNGYPPRVEPGSDIILSRRKLRDFTPRASSTIGQPDHLSLLRLPPTSKEMDVRKAFSRDWVLEHVTVARRQKASMVINQLILFTIKVDSTLKCCYLSAPRWPMVHILLALATCDFALNTRSYRVSYMLLALHFVCIHAADLAIGVCKDGSRVHFTYSSKDSAPDLL